MNIIAELAGADSIAAIELYLKENPADFIIPTIAISFNEDTTTLNAVVENYNNYITYLRDKDYHIHDLIICAPCADLWNNLQDINLPSQCVLCHMYCHLIRLPLVKYYNASLLTGERLSHNGRIKWNQNGPVLELYSKIFDYFNIPIIRPLEYIKDTQLVKNSISSIPINTNSLICDYKSPSTDNADLSFTNDLYEQLIPIIERYINDVQLRY